MISKLGHHINKPLLVSIPPIFGNTQLHRCRLIGTEAAGLWLESDDFPRAAGGDAASLPALVFVPFTQIACLAGDSAVPPPRKPVVPVTGTSLAVNEQRGAGSRRKSR
jgi:hypothetical protein